MCSACQEESCFLNLSEFARVCGLSRTTVYKYVGLLEG
ncbi:MAG: helix-turn-helix domain-containing protein [Clostridia bacterium]|nr:helix-turn-helix domain-containing protein [Clostridia bacterium]